MKTTFKQYILSTESKLLPAKSYPELLDSIKDGKFTLDGSLLDTETVKISNMGLTSLEGCPYEWVRSLDCSNNKLTSLKGSPIVLEMLNCSSNQITTLMNSPESVSSLICNHNKITSLVGCPSIINEYFDLRNNNISSLKDIHKHLNEMDGGSISFEGNPVNSHILGLLKIRGLRRVSFTDKKLQKIINKYLPEGDIFACQQELIDAGFEAHAQL